MIQRIRTIDAHAAGEPLRLIVDGFPRVEGATMLDKREFVAGRHDDLRRALMLEPRGHADMYGALLTEPVHPGSDAGILFMHNQGYSTMCGHGIIAAVTIGLERGLLTLPPGRRELVLDAPAGRIEANFRPLPGHGPDAGARTSCPLRIESVAFRNVPSFVLKAALPIQVAGRRVRADVAFGGAFYAIVDAEAVGIGLHAERLPELRRAGMAIKAEVEAAVRVVHPLDPALSGIYGTIFTGPPARPDADLRNVTVFADAEVDRSPCGTGTSAVMAVLYAMGLLPAHHAFAHESLIGTLFRGRITGHREVGEYQAVVPEIEGSAWITGEHTFLIDEEDPLREGFRV